MTMMTEARGGHFLRISQLYKSFNGARAVDGVSLNLKKGQILCLLGPSGCGKTTLLRLIAGLERPDAGRVLFEERDLSGVPPHQRDFGLMFQEFALFPHKNVGQNVAFGLQMKQVAEIQARTQEILRLVGLAGFEERDIDSLSGGERQRVALARSLAPRPRLLMLDEPLGSLDRVLRERLMLEVRQILKKVGLTAIYVTHDQTEAFAVADRIIVMNRGRIEQDATPEQLYRWPATPFVARFLGFNNLLEVTCLGDDQIQTPWGVWPVAAKNYPSGAKAIALIRPEAASLTPLAGQVFDAGLPALATNRSLAEIFLEAELSQALFRGRFYQITVVAGDIPLTFEVSQTELPPAGHKVSLWLDPAAISLLEPTA